MPQIENEQQVEDIQMVSPPSGGPSDGPSDRTRDPHENQYASPPSPIESNQSPPQAERVMIVFPASPQNPSSSVPVLGKFQVQRPSVPSTDTSTRRSYQTPYEPSATIRSTTNIPRAPNHTLGSSNRPGFEIPPRDTNLIQHYQTSAPGSQHNSAPYRETLTPRTATVADYNRLMGRFASNVRATTAASEGNRFGQFVDETRGFYATRKVEAASLGHNTQQPTHPINTTRQPTPPGDNDMDRDDRAPIAQADTTSPAVHIESPTADISQMLNSHLTRYRFGRDMDKEIDRARDRQAASRNKTFGNSVARFPTPAWLAHMYIPHHPDLVSVAARAPKIGDPLGPNPAAAHPTPDESANPPKRAQRRERKRKRQQSPPTVEEAQRIIRQSRAQALGSNYMDKDGNTGGMNVEPSNQNSHWTEEVWTNRMEMSAEECSSGAGLQQAFKKFLKES